jgi:hypothetical protein
MKTRLAALLPHLTSFTLVLGVVWGSVQPTGFAWGS